MKLGPIWRACIGVTVAALISAAAPSVASAQGWGWPDVTRAPTLAGSPYVGQRVDAVGAAWSGRSLTVAWMWLRCDSDSLWSCRLIEGTSSPYYTVSQRDLGKRLRALVVVSNRDGRDYGWTDASSAATMPPPPPPPVAQPSPPVVEPPVVAPPTPPVVAATPQLMRPAPVVRLSGWLTVRGARITLLTVRAPRGARISVSCAGIGCPRVSRAQAAKLTRLRRYENMYRAGTRIVVRVTRPGFIGKYTRIRIRHGEAPLRFDRCLSPGVKGPTECPR
jgi:hypothetical protein